MSMRTRREYGLPWPWHLLRAPHPPRPASNLVSSDPPKTQAGRFTLKASAMPGLARSDRKAGIVEIQLAVKELRCG